MPIARREQQHSSYFSIGIDSKNRAFMFLIQNKILKLMLIKYLKFITSIDVLDIKLISLTYNTTNTRISYLVFQTRNMDINYCRCDWRNKNVFDELAFSKQMLFKATQYNIHCMVLFMTFHCQTKERKWENNLMSYILKNSAIFSWESQTPILLPHSNGFKRRRRKWKKILYLLKKTKQKTQWD